MEHQEWLARWRDGRIGFHQSEINHYLIRHHEVFPAAPSRILVPLCGKSLDMLWLREQGHEVLGVELSPLGVAAFFEENDLSPEHDRHGPFERYRVEGIEILQGDFFALTTDLAGAVHGAYDRAATVALPRELRDRMAAHLATLLGPGGPILLVSFDYPQHEMQPPPHSIPESEIRRLFETDFEVVKLSDNEALAAYPRFQLAGLTSLHERVFRITRR